MILSESVRRLKWKTNRTFSRGIQKPYFTAIPSIRSQSDSGFYPELARRAALNSRVFSTFKNSGVYRTILEHCDAKEGELYLEQIRKKWPLLLENIDKFKINDQIGKPFLTTYPGIGEISPTTLRYIKVLCDLQELFGDLSNFDVVEIGGGYGGQFLLADLTWSLSSWTIFDLDPVLHLISRYLECYLLNSSYKVTTLNRFDPKAASFDLAISNYAFSELPRVLQLQYISKVLSKAKRGYMTMNPGKTEDKSTCLTKDELRHHFPNLRIYDEQPLTAPNNYILVWGE